jgi:hypothetical protein
LWTQSEFSFKERKQSDTFCAHPCRAARFSAARGVQIFWGAANATAAVIQRRRLHVFIKAAGRRNELLVYWDEKEYILGRGEK